MDLIGSKITNSFVDKSNKISNKYALKLVGLNVSQVSESDLLNDLVSHIEPTSINALMADNFNNCFILFLSDVESVCKLIQTKLQLLDTQIRILPLVETFVIHSVYPFISNDQLTEIFRSFGTVLEIHKLSVAPNSSLFSHVLSSKCEISFLLPGMEAELHLPEHVQHPPFKFTVRKLCPACSTEGHSLLHCPDIDFDFDVLQKPFKSEVETDFLISNSAVSCTSVLEPTEKFNSSQEISFSDLKEEMLYLGVESSCGSSDSSAPSSSKPMQDCCRKRLKKLKHNLKKLSSRKAKKIARKKLKKNSKSGMKIVDVKVEE